MASQNQLAARRWWWLVLLATALGTAGAFGALQLMPKQYSATCRLFVATAPGTTPSESYQAAMFGQSRVAAYLDLIKGDRVATNAIESLGINLSAEDLQQRLDAKADAESVVINVSVKESQPKLSADLANAVCTQFLAVAADAEGPNPLVNVRMIEDAVPPQQQISPSAKSYLGLGAATGLFVGLALVVLLGRLNSNRGSAPTDALLDETRSAAPIAPTGSMPNSATVQSPNVDEIEESGDWQGAGAHRARRQS